MRNLLASLSFGLLLVGILFFRSQAVATATGQPTRLELDAPAAPEFHRPTLPTPIAQPAGRADTSNPALTR